jgi:hypothetical protein
MYVDAKMILVETIPEIGGVGYKGESSGGMNTCVIYLTHCKNFCKCHNVPPPSTITKK